MLNTPKKKRNIIPKLIGDARRLKQCLINLVKNALKFTKQGSVAIKVSYTYEPDHLLIFHVKDTGTGIAKEDFPKLFTCLGKLQRTA